MNKILKAKIVEIYGSQANFAQAMEIDETIISRVVRNRRRLSPEDQQRWGRVLKFDPEQIFNQDV